MWGSNVKKCLFYSTVISVISLWNANVLKLVANPVLDNNISWFIFEVTKTNLPILAFPVCSLGSWVLSVGLFWFSISGGICLLHPVSGPFTTCASLFCCPAVGPYPAKFQPSSVLPSFNTVRLVMSLSSSISWLIVCCICNGFSWWHYPISSFAISCIRIHLSLWPGGGPAWRCTFSINETLNIPYGRYSKRHF